MRLVIAGCDHAIGPWVTQRTGGLWLPEASACLGLWHTEKGLLAGIVYDHFNGANVHCQFAAVKEENWATPKFLRAIFNFPFKELGAKRMSAGVLETNHTSRRFVERLGFEEESFHRDGHPAGSLIGYVLWPSNCRWL